MSPSRPPTARRKTPDIPDYYREEGELVVPSYGYFIRGAQTTFSGVERWVPDVPEIVEISANFPI